MRLNYYFHGRSNSLLTAFLTDNGIKFRTTGDGKLVPVLVNFSIKEGSPLISKLIRDFGLSPIITPVYSERDLCQAKLLWLTPKKQRVEIINHSEAFGYFCRRIDARGIQHAWHKEQIQSLCVESEPKTGGQTAFWSSTTSFAEVFADYRVRDLADIHDLQCLHFDPVTVSDGTTSNKIFQLTTDNVVNQATFIFTGDEQVMQCPHCGKRQYIIDRMFQPKLDAKNINMNHDLYVTERIFGEGISRPLYFISQRFYQLLKSNGMAGDLSLVPIILS